MNLFVKQIPPRIREFHAWVKATSINYAMVQDEATMEALRRFRLFSALTVMVNILYIFEFWIFPKQVTLVLPASYVSRIGWVHAVMACTMTTLGVLAHFRSRNGAPVAFKARALQLSICTVYLAFGITVSAVDQMVSTSITSFVMICVLVGVMSLMRPALLLPLLVGSLVVLYFVMAMVQPDKVALERIHGDGRLVVGLSFVVATVIWVQYVAQVLLRRKLVDSNQALADKQAELTFTATHDELTGLINRREFVRLAEIELTRSARVPSATGLVMMDLDFFKKINDSYGHLAGDDVLQQAAKAMLTAVRAMDVVARMGGEEFAVLLPNTDGAGAIAVAEKIKGQMAHSIFRAKSVPILVTASFGVSCLTEGMAGTVEELYAAADRALYTAKNNGRNCVEFEDTQTIAVPSNVMTMRT
jgi:diguanylate cyclase (GGDEF)-like protein